MILRISAENFELSEELNKYAYKKLEGLDRFIARKERATTLVEATFSEQTATEVKTCQLSVKVRREDFTARESTQHLYAALDVAAASVEQQLRDYKKHNAARLKHYMRRKRSAE